MNVLTFLLSILLLPATTSLGPGEEGAAPPGPATSAGEETEAAPPMELVLVYRSWLGHMIEERYDEAAALVLPEDLEALRSATLAELRAASAADRERRFSSLGVGSLAEVEAMSAAEFFVEGLRSGGNVLPRLLRASQITILGGEVQGRSGWLLIHMSSSARGGEIIASNEIRQGFALRGETWYVSLQPVPDRSARP